MSDNEELKKELEELKELLKAKPDINESRDQSNKWMAWTRNVIALFGVVVALGVNWGITKTKIEAHGASIAANKAAMTEKINKVEHDVHELQLKQAGDDKLLEGIKEDVKEIKKDVKSLANRRR